MSAGSISGKPLSVSALNCGSLSVAGTPVIGGSLTTLLGDAATSVRTTSATLGISVATGAQTGVLTTTNSIVLPPGGGGGGAVSSVASANAGLTVAPTTGAVVVTLPPVGTAGAIAFPASITTDVYGRVSASTAGTAPVASIVGPGGSATSGALTFAGAGVSQAGSTFTFTGTGSGIASLHDAGTGATTSTTPTITVGAVTNTSAATTLAFTATAGGVALAGNLQGSGAGGGGPLAWGVLTIPATPGALINVYPTGGTAPAAPAAPLVVQGGTLASTATFTPTTFMAATWAAGTLGGTAIAPPGGGSLACGRPGSTQAYTTLSIGAGSFVVGQVINWVLWSL